MSAGEIGTPSFSSLTPIAYPLASFIQPAGLGADPSFRIRTSILSAPCLHDGTCTAFPDSLAYQGKKVGSRSGTCRGLRSSGANDRGTRVAGRVHWETPLPPLRNEEELELAATTAPQSLLPPMSPVPASISPQSGRVLLFKVKN